MKVVKVGVTRLTGHRVSTFQIPATTEGKRKLADKLRNDPTKSEALLSAMLDKAKIKFKSQKVMFGYIADFYFPGCPWIVELDGKRHDKVRDQHRDEVFLRHGIRTLRIASSRMFTEPDLVLTEIKATIMPRRQKTKRTARTAATSPKRIKTDTALQDFRFMTAGL